MTDRVYLNCLSSVLGQSSTGQGWPLFIRTGSSGTWNGAWVFLSASRAVGGPQAHTSLLYPHSRGHLVQPSGSLFHLQATGYQMCLQADWVPWTLDLCFQC